MTSWWIALVLALAGCACNQEYLTERQVLVDEFNNTIPVCQGEQDCKVKWQAAHLWVVRNTARNIQTANERLAGLPHL